MWKVGKVANMAEVSPDTLRFYEREGLIAPDSKSAGGYRLYREDAVRRIRFIKHAQQCGFTLVEIKELLSLKSSPRACCDDVHARAVEKKLQIEAKIKALTTMSNALTALIAACASDNTPVDECAILATLESTTTAVSAVED
ncbi:MAG: heavy metal-responsive transcriptional regulator [Rhodospirillaceae bacterium]